jgi:hypothetical protein
LTELVDLRVTRRKFERELAHWRAHAPHQERGWLLLDCDPQVPSVEIAFLAPIAISSGFLPAAACAIRLTYENYDLWPPSLTFIDALTRQPTMPHVRAYQPGPQGPRDAVVNGHPHTGLPFLCLRGIREYHWHPQHSGDDWLLYRSVGEGTMTTICDRVWQFMVQNIVGLNVVIQALPTMPFGAQLRVSLAQGDVEASRGMKAVQAAAAVLAPDGGRQ